MARGPNLSAARTPDQFCGGCGSRQRKLPTGGAAYGTPLNSRMPDTFTPSSVPLAMVTRGGTESLFN